MKQHLLSITATISCLIFLNIACSASALSRQQPEVYQSGYIDYFLRLALVAKPSLFKGCALLEQGKLSDAEPIFAQEIKQHPENFMGYVGFLQAAVGHRDSLLERYEQEATDRPSAQNQFKLGVLAYYMLGERVQAGVLASNSEQRLLVNEAQYNLKSAYLQSGDPLVAFTYAASMPITSWGNPIPIYENTIRRIGGETVYASYERAKMRNWDAPTPSIPSIPRYDLVYLRWAVGGIDSQYSILNYTPRKTPSGQVVYELDKSKYTPEQTRAMAYLESWIAALRKAAA